MVILDNTVNYAELVCQSNFSFLTGASHPEELVEQAQKLGYSALALTDECSVAGVVRAHAYINKHNLNLKLIVGARFHFQHTLDFVLIAPSRKAYAELCRIITNSRRRCKKGKYQLSQWDLTSIEYCYFIWLPTKDQNTNTEYAESLLSLYKHRLFIGLRRLLVAGESQYTNQCRTIANEYGIKVLACGDVLMHEKNRLPLQHILTAIKNNTTVEKLGQQAISNAEQSLRPLSTLKKLFTADEISNTADLAKNCHFNLAELKYEYPSELIPKHHNPTTFLKSLVEQGKKLRFPNGLSKQLNATIDKELNLIEEMQYEHFFITIYDIVQFAKSKNILYQGRGSAANSVVCYCLEITAVNPEQIQVLFERFISKERREPPDIDVDFEHQRREEIFQYIYKKYGREHTAIAASVVTFRLKSAIREVGKALSMNETQLDFFIKNINRRDRKANWVEQVIELGLETNATRAKWFTELVNQIREFPRHLSQHVGGFVISSGPLYELVPTENAAMERRTVIQWDKDDLETLELLKVDVLALGMLTAIRRSFDLIRHHYDYDCSIAQISNYGDDPQVFKQIQQADTVGIFQIESRAQMSMLPRLKPSTYYDLVIQIAIVRPGPIQGKMVHPFLKRREGSKAVTYPSEEIQDILSRTMGVPIFQEQVIKVAMVAAGFTGGEADQLRRSMGKWKYNGEMEKFRKKLIDGMLERGYDIKFAEQLFEQILGFGDYGFPESHSASFAILAYVSSWIKYYFPEVFYCALLNSQPMGFYSPSQLVQDAQRHNIKVLPPCINHSYWEHRLEVLDRSRLALRLGLKLIKGLRQSSIEELLTHRKTEFKSLGELNKYSIKNYELQALASANALKSLSGNRYSSRWTLANSHNELGLFELTCDKETFNLKPNEYDSLVEDYNTLGLSVEQHPIQLLRNMNKIGRYTPASELYKHRHKSVVNVVGLVTGRQSPGTASDVTFMTLEDDTGNINVIVWLATARAQKKSFLSSKIVKVSGILEKEKEVILVIAGKITDLTEEFESLCLDSRDFH
ncbi:MAG: error-prone DNA polymerase [Gammaproteobacteria bacterium]|nr:error-prone DNA polymerase [Gammaproteobacteria bacterium]